MKNSGSGYAMCGECGAPSGASCVDDDNRPASRCAGRRLTRIGAIRQVAREAEAAAKRAEAAADRMRATADRMVADARERAADVQASLAVIKAKEDAAREDARQRAAAVKARKAEREAKRLAHATRGPVMTACFWCNGAIPVTGNRTTSTPHPCCGERECKRARSRLHAQAARQRNTVITRTT